jgi:hypothetical protein
MGSTNDLSPLPIELLYFNAKLNNDAVELNGLQPLKLITISSP